MTPMSNSSHCVAQVTSCSIVQTLEYIATQDQTRYNAYPSTEKVVRFILRVPGEEAMRRASLVVTDLTMSLTLSDQALRTSF
jgi:hypothetical protein